MYKVNKIKFFLIIMFSFGLITMPVVLIAETQIEVQEDEIIVEINPNNPQPYEDVTINLSSYATDLNKAIIVWQNDSRTILSGIGKTKYSFKATGPNTRSIFDISIKPFGSMSNINKKIIITPSEVEIMWEAVGSYTPPFYKGKSLPISGGLIKAVAIPNTNTIKSGNGNITYSWKNNDSAVPDSSGYNKNSYVFKNSLFDDKNEVTVIASSVEGNYSAEKTISIPVYKPKIIFYKKSPTEGTLYGVALNKETTMTEDEMTVVAEPYFLPLKNNEDDFSYDWKINNQNIATPSKKTELTVRPTSRGGYATIDMIIESSSELFQKVSNQLKMQL